MLGAGPPRARIFVSHLRGRQRGERAALSAARTYDIAANSAQGTQNQDKDQEQEQEQEQEQKQEQNGSDINSTSNSDNEEMPVTAHGEECLCCTSENDDKEALGMWAWEPRQPTR